MFKQFWLGLILAVAIPLWSQVAANTATDTAATEDLTMQTPPPVSGAAYPSTPVGETRSNYLRGGITFNTAYSDNVLGGTSSNLVSDISYSIWPSIALDKTTPRLHWVLSYSPGFTFYQRTSSRNQADQNVAIDFRYRLSPHVTLNLRDSLEKSSNYFSQPDVVSATPVTGNAQNPVVTVIAPLSDRLSNTGTPEITYQFSANGMVGASGTFTNLHYLNPAQVPGLFDSSTAGGAAFYSHRLSGKHYIGATYQYSRILAYPVGAQSEVQTHSIFLFYTIYLRPRLSLSLSGGPQHSQVDQSPLPSSQMWSPSGTASLGWQGQHTAAAVSYSRIITGGGGLSGAFRSSNVNFSVRQQLSPNWNAGLSAGYSINRTVTPFFFLASPGGHSVGGSASLERRLGEHFSAQAGYSRLYQSYSNIGAISSAPDTSREWLSISYQFARPLGR